MPCSNCNDLAAELKTILHVCGRVRSPNQTAGAESSSSKLEQIAGLCRKALEKRDRQRAGLCADCESAATLVQDGRSVCLDHFKGTPAL